MGATPSEDVFLEVVGTRSRGQKGGRCKRGPTNSQAPIRNRQAGLNPLQVRVVGVGNGAQAVSQEAVELIEGGVACAGRKA